MRGAFVLRLRTDRGGTRGQIEGSVEEVDTGREIRFQSGTELLAFLRERVAQIRDTSRKEKPDEHDDGGR